jgi:hypothetical protein
MLLLTSCGPSPDKPATPGKPIAWANQYHGIKLNMVTKEFQLPVSQSQDGWSVSSFSRFGSFLEIEVKERHGMRTDHFVGQNGRIVDWYSYKTLAQSPKGPVTFVQRFQPGFLNPYPEFSLEQGETGAVIQETISPEMPLEAAFLFYVYASLDWLSAMYSSKGELRQISSHTGPNTNMWYKESSPSNPYGAYPIPDTITGTTSAIPLNDAVLEGLGKVEYRNIFPKIVPSKMIGSYLIRQYAQGTIFRVLSADSSGKTVSNRTVQFTTRPFDPDVIQAQKTN